METSSASVIWRCASGAMLAPPATSSDEKAMTTSVASVSARACRAGESRPTRRRNRKWRPRRTATTAPRKMIHTKQSRAPSSYHLKVAWSTYRLNTPRKTSPTRTAISATHNHSTITLLRGRASFGQHAVEELLADALLQVLVHGLRPLLERLQIVNLIDLNSLGLHRGQRFSLVAHLVFAVPGAGDRHRLVDHFLEFGRQGLVFGAGHHPGRRRIAVACDGVVLRDLVEFVRHHRRCRQLEPVDRPLFQGQVHLAPLHRDRVGPKRLEELDQRRDRRHADRLPLEIVWCLGRPLVGQDVAEAITAPEAEALRPKWLQPLQQFAADRPVHHLPDVLAAFPEKGHIGRQELGVPLTSD